MAKKEYNAKGLGLWDSSAIILSIVVGVGIFKIPSQVADYIRSPLIIMLAWLIGGLICLCGALCYAELASIYPFTGGNYVYLKKIYGSMPAFLFGWIELIAIRPGSIAAVSFIAAEYICALININYGFEKGIAVLLILLLCLINIVGIQHSARIQSYLTFAKITILMVMMIIGFWLGSGSFLNWAEPMRESNGNHLRGFLAALIPILWTYGGWHENTFVAGETKRATWTVPLGLILGISGVIALYLGVNALYMYLFPIDSIHEFRFIGTNAMERIWGKAGRKILEGTVIVFSISAINSMIMTGSRVIYALADDFSLFKMCNSLHEKYKTPLGAILITTILSIVLVIIGTFTKLLFFTGILVWLIFGFVGAGLFVLRKSKPNLTRPYKVWGYPITPILFVSACVVLVINTLLVYTSESIVGLLLMLGGIPVYMYLKKKDNTKRRPI